MPYFVLQVTFDSIPMVRMLTEIGIQCTKDMYELAIRVRADRIVKAMKHSLGMKGDMKMAKQQEAYDPQTLPGIDLTSLGTIPCLTSSTSNQSYCFTWRKRAY